MHSRITKTHKQIRNGYQHNKVVQTTNKKQSEVPYNIWPSNRNELASIVLLKRW